MMHVLADAQMLESEIVDQLLDAALSRDYAALRAIAENIQDHEEEIQSLLANEFSHFEDGSLIGTLEYTALRLSDTLGEILNRGQEKRIRPRFGFKAPWKTVDHPKGNPQLVSLCQAYGDLVQTALNLTTTPLGANLVASMVDVVFRLALILNLYGQRPYFEASHPALAIILSQTADALPMFASDGVARALALQCVNSPTLAQEDKECLQRSFFGFD